ncbi:hypothetical protein GEMRC1_006099 [Eukaryota sp. GEM-RC1]
MTPLKILLNDGRHTLLECDPSSISIRILEDQIRFEFDIPSSARLRLIHSGHIIQSSEAKLDELTPSLAESSIIHCTFTTAGSLASQRLLPPPESDNSASRGFSRLLDAGVEAEEVLITRLQFYIFRQRSLVPDAVPSNPDDMLHLEDQWIDNSLGPNSNNLNDSLLSSESITGMNRGVSSSSSRLARVVANELRSFDASLREFEQGDALDFVNGFVVGFVYIFSFVSMAFENNLSKEFRLGLVLGIFGFLTFSLLRFWSFAGF